MIKVGIMTIAQNPSLIDRLRHCAELWTRAHGATHARLGRAVVNDGGYFTRLDSQAKGTTTASLERFAQFLGNPGNWPEGHDVPKDVQQFVAITGVHAGDPTAERQRDHA